MMLDDDSTIFMLPPSPPESRLVPDFGPRSELLARGHDNFASTWPESIGDEVVVANMDGPDPDSGTCCFGAR